MQSITFMIMTLSYMHNDLKIYVHPNKITSHRYCLFHSGGTTQQKVCEVKETHTTKVKLK